MSALPIHVIGAGGLAREMHALVEDIDPAGERWTLGGFVDRESGNPLPMNPDAFPVASEKQVLTDAQRGSCFVIGIGSPSARARAIAPFLEAKDRLQFDFPVLVHPSVAYRRRSVTIGEGTVITAGCVMTTDIVIGSFNLLNWNSTIGHDCRIGDYNVINPGCHVSGAVTIGHRNLIGAGSVILQRLTIGDDCVIGAGSVVTKDLESGYVYIGSPARPVRVNEPRA